MASSEAATTTKTTPSDDSRKRQRKQQQQQQQQQQQRKSQGDATDAEDAGDLDVYDEGLDEETESKPLRVGDFVSFRQLPTTAGIKGGFISAEGVLDDDCLVDERPNQFDQCVFQLCIQNQARRLFCFFGVHHASRPQYSALKEYVENVSYLEELQALQVPEELPRDPHARRSTIQTVEDDAIGSKEFDTVEADAAKLSKLVGTLELAMENERVLNETYMKASIGRAIHFGDIVQLLHVKSNKYLTVEPTQVATQERENLRVSLSEYGSQLSWFTLMPAFKIDREGDTCQSGASIALQVTERTGEQIHCSESPLKKVGGQFKEVNSSLERSVWRMLLYSFYHDGSNAPVHCGDLVRLVEPELNSYLRIINTPDNKKTICVLTPQEDAPVPGEHHLDSTSLWLVEGFHKPAVGGPLAYASRSYRLRHLNTGKYLALRTKDLWRKGIMLAIALKSVHTREAPGGRVSSIANDKSGFEFTALDGSLMPNCAMYFHQPQVAGQRKAKLTSSSSSTTPTKLRGKETAILDKSPIQVECRGRWMHCGGVVDQTTDVACIANARRLGTLSLVIQRATSGTKTAIHTNNILVGVAAIPRLNSFKLIFNQTNGTTTERLRLLEGAVASFVDVIDQLTNFLLRKSLQEEPDYAALAKSVLRDLPYDRQMLLCEQGVLVALLNILDILESLVTEVADRSGETPNVSLRFGGTHPEPIHSTSSHRRIPASSSSRRKRKSATTANASNDDLDVQKDMTELDEVLHLQRSVAMRIFWVLNLATRNNAFIQMHVASELRVFVAYTFKEPVASQCLVHMLSTNQTLQDTKVTDVHARQIVQMMEGCHLHAQHLDMLRALCSCLGRGVGSNQCRIVDLWLKAARGYLINLVVADDQPDLNNVASWSLHKTLAKGLVKYVLGNELLSGEIPALYLKWETPRKDCAPADIGGPNAAVMVPIDVVFANDRRKKGATRGSSSKSNCRRLVAKFFTAQVYLFADLCLDRNYVAIEIVRDAMPFSACLTIILNTKLPSTLKAAVVRVISTVYVDRDPSTRSRVPHLAHNWSEIAEGKNSARPEIPEQQRVCFLLLQDVIDQYLVKMADGNSWGAYKQCMMELLLRLVQFGYYSTLNEMQRLVCPLVKDLSCVDGVAAEETTGGGGAPLSSGRLSNKPRRKSFTASFIAKDATKDTVAKNTKCPRPAQVAPSTGETSSPRSSSSMTAARGSVMSLDEEDDEETVACSESVRDSRRNSSLLSRFECSLEPHPDSWQARVFGVMDSIPFVLCILGIVTTMLIFSAMRVDDITLENKHAVTPLSVTGFVFTAVLVVEVSFRWYCYVHMSGRVLYFLVDPESFPFNIIDVGLALLDLVVVLGIFGALVGGAGPGPAKAGKALRIIKLVRAIRAAKAINKLSAKGDETKEPDWELPARYYSTSHQKIATMREVVTVLGEVSLLHRDNNLAALLASFKISHESEAISTEVEPYTLFSDIVSKSPKLATLAAPMLEDRRAAGIQNRFDEILLDLCLYHNEELVQSALNLLMVQHSARDSLLKDVVATQLLSDPEEERRSTRLRKVVRDLQSAAERHELWGHLKTAEDRQMDADVKGMLRELTQACMQRRQAFDDACAYQPVPQVQTLLANLGALGAAMTVMGLHAEMDEISDPEILGNIRDLLRRCCVFLEWFVVDHQANQLACFEHLETFLLCFEHDVRAPCVLAATVRGNAELTKAFPSKTVTECANRVAIDNNSTYLQLLEALLWMGADGKENNTQLQFAVLRELTLPTRAKKVLWLCIERDGREYEERLRLMEEETANLKNANRKQDDEPELAPDMDRVYMPEQLRYHCGLLDVFSSCALGSVNITTVEAKLQNLIPPNTILVGLLDDRTTTSVRAALASLLLEVVVDIEITIPDFEKNPLMWRFLFHVPEALHRAKDIMRESDVLVADGPTGAKARLDLRYAILCVKIVNSFFEHYLVGPAVIREVKESSKLSKDLENVVPAMLGETEATTKERDNTCNSPPIERRDSIGSDEEYAHAVHPMPQLTSELASSRSVDSSLRSSDREIDLPRSANSPGVNGGGGGPADTTELASNDALASSRSGGAALSSSSSSSSTWFMSLMKAIHDKCLKFYRSDDAKSRLPVDSRRCLYRMLELMNFRVRLDFDDDAPEDAVESIRNESVRTVPTSLSAIVAASSPKNAFYRFVRELKSSNDTSMFEDEDKADVVVSFELLKSRYDAYATVDLRIEPLIEKLVAHTLGRLAPSYKGLALDEDCSRTTRWLIQVFRTMIEKKWGMTIHERDDEGGEEQDAAGYELQKLLNSCGVTKLCLKLIAPGIDRELSLEATKLCVALLFREGGNKIVQAEINAILSRDCELFFTAVRNTLAEIKNLFVYEHIELHPDDDDDVPVPQECIVMRLIQLMSEGHYEPNQSIMRDQPGHSNSINLLEDLVDLLSALSRDKRRCRRSTKTALQACSTLLEFIQGPCKANQLHLAIHTELVEILNRITRSKPIRDCKPDEDDEIKKVALEIYEGLLEGETDESVVVTRIISVIDLNVLKSIIEQEDPLSSTTKSEGELNEIQIECLVLLQMFFDFKPALRDSVQLSPRVQRLMGRRVMSVEVVWHGRTLRRFFPVPPICEHISEATRQKLVTDIDRSSDETRLQDFLKRAKDIYREISHQALLEGIQVGSFNLAKVFSRTNQEYATWLAFFVALVINTMLLVFAEHKRSDDHKWLAKSGGNIWHGNSGQVQVVLSILNIFNIALSSFTLVLFVVVRCPVKYHGFLAHDRSKLTALALTAIDHLTVYYLVYTILAGLAVKYRFCSSLLLLDIVVKDATSADVINAIVYPRKQLAATMMLGSIVVYIFAVLIFENYADTFAYTDDDAVDHEDCKSLVRCFAVTAMYGLRLSGGIGDIMSHTWSSRLWLDFLYFFIVLIVLLNVVFGVIIDTFSDLRSQKKERLRNTLENCFICGLDNMTFDRISPGGFRRHIHHDHYMWNYLNFIIFIWQQDRDEDDGLELHVRKQIEKNDISWLPVGRAICLTEKHPEATMTDQITALRTSIDQKIEANEKRLLTSMEHSTEIVRHICDHAAQKQHKRIEELEQKIAQLTAAAAAAAPPPKEVAEIELTPRPATVPVGAPRQHDTTPVAAQRPDTAPVVAHRQVSPDVVGDDAVAAQRSRDPVVVDAGPGVVAAAAAAAGGTHISMPLVGASPPDSRLVDSASPRRESTGCAIASDLMISTTRTLAVRIHRATNLVENHLLGSGDPFVRARAFLGDRLIGETERVAMANSSIVFWPQTATTSLELADPAPAPLRFEIWHCTRQGLGCFLGQAYLPWAHVQAGSRTTLLLERKPEAKMQLYVQGKIEVTATITTLGRPSGSASTITSPAMRPQSPWPTL
ncbi:hypothetical protein CTAYLR_006814 [Chrysophaeum taylorii]|uniref:Inositol 1,4,5-trisphosphate receptor n=1 Tax=Chrysophaeum taylorii TaxID=2483200 RepID=A0AAD7UD70_9STRA|nr:hypothetical protein CTAYLR_006814 [Chrysophaeum taylorii]